MKTLFTILVSLLILGVCVAQDYTFTAKNINTPVTVVSATKTSAQADTVDIQLNTIDGRPVCYSLQVLAVQNSGTTEGYIDLYKSNDLVTFELVATRVANDTLVSGNMVGWRADTDGYEAKYLRIIITNKSQTQNTTYTGKMTIWKTP